MHCSNNSSDRNSNNPVKSTKRAITHIGVIINGPIVRFAVLIARIQLKLKSHVDAPPMSNRTDAIELQFIGRLVAVLGLYALSVRGLFQFVTGIL